MRKMKYMSAIALAGFLFASCDLDLFPQMDYNQGNVEDAVVNEDTGEVSQYKTRGDMEGLRDAIYSSWLKGNVIQEGILLDGMVYAECRADNAYGGNPGTPELMAIEANTQDSENKNVVRDWDYYQEAVHQANQIICLAFLNLAVKGLDDHFTESFGRTHNIGGIDRLVGRDKNELLCAVLFCHSDSFSE